MSASFNNRRTNRPKAPVNLKPIQPFMTAIPVAGKVRVLKVNATSGAAAIILAKQVLVEKGVLAASQDVRFVSKAVPVTAKIGDRFGSIDAEDRAAKKARELVGV